MRLWIEVVREKERGGTLRLVGFAGFELGRGKQLSFEVEHPKFEEFREFCEG